jgi:hypothetical protein
VKQKCSRQQMQAKVAVGRFPFQPLKLESRLVGLRLPSRLPIDISLISTVLQLCRKNMDSKTIDCTTPQFYSSRARRLR